MGKTLIYGSGESGRGAEKLLRELEMPYEVYIDCGEDGGNVLNGVDTLILSPGVRFDSDIAVKAREHGIEVIAEIEFAYRHCLADIIAVTGTNGKTTTVTLIEKLLNECGIDACALGNIGVSFSSKVMKLGLSDVAVLEISSFQLEGVKKFTPKIGICLNIAEDHLERHGSMNNYISAKRRLFANQTSDDYAILNYDDAVVRGWADTMNADTYFYSTKSVVRGAYICGNSIYFKDRSVEYVCSTGDIKMSGEHNLSNALAVITVAKILNLPNSLIIKVLSDFDAPDHRIRLTAVIDGKRYYNDSKATNIHATLCACGAMQGKTVLLLGGYDKGLDYTALFNELPLKVSTVICYGANRKKLIETGKNICSLTVVEAQDLSEAVSIASKIHADNVLLSPATSSYDAYKNFEERGAHFTELVASLKIDAENLNRQNTRK